MKINVFREDNRHNSHGQPCLRDLDLSNLVPRAFSLALGTRLGPKGSLKNCLMFSQSLVMKSVPSARLITKLMFYVQNLTIASCFVC